MEIIYVTLFNSEADVISLGFCSSYTHAEEIFDNTIKSFVKSFYALTSATSVAVKVCKYDDSIASASKYISLFKNDTSFPKGVIFVKKRHEATVYEKDSKGNVKYLGRISVLALAVEISEQQRNKIELLEARLSLNATLISQQDLSLKRQNAEIARLERNLETERRGNAVHKSDDTSVAIEVIEEVVIPRAPKPPTPFQLLKTSQKPLIEELKEKFAAKAQLLHHKKIQCDAAALDTLVKEIEDMACFRR